MTILPSPETSTPFRNRIVGTGEEDPASLLANPKNWRTHPREQERTLTDLLEQVGWVQNVVVNRRTGLLVDGHLRVKLAQQRREPLIPVVYVDLSEEEEALILTALDPIAGLAGIDEERLAAILAEVTPVAEGAGLRNLLAELASEIDLDEDETQEPARPEVTFSEELLEEHNYVVLYFDNAIDWLQLKSILELPTVKALHSRPGYQSAGVGRVVRGPDALQRIMAHARTQVEPPR